MMITVARTRVVMAVRLGKELDLKHLGDYTMRVNEFSKDCIHKKEFLSFFGNSLTSSQTNQTVCSMFPEYIPGSYAFLLHNSLHTHFL